MYGSERKRTNVERCYSSRKDLRYCEVRLTIIVAWLYGYVWRLGFRPRTFTEPSRTAHNQWRRYRVALVHVVCCRHASTSIESVVAMPSLRLAPFADMEGESTD